MSLVGHMAQKGKKETHAKFQLGNQKGRNNMKDRDLHSRTIILKLI
jgi:hypothetical protein